MKPLISELKLLTQLPEPFFNRVCYLRCDRATDEATASPLVTLAVSVTKFLHGHMPYSEAEVLDLLQKMLPVLNSHAELLDAVWERRDETVEVESLDVSFADHRYVTWRGLDKFYDPTKAEFVNLLPSPPIFVTMFHTGAAYFRIKSLVELHRKQQGTDADTTTDTAKHTG